MNYQTFTAKPKTTREKKDKSFHPDSKVLVYIGGHKRKVFRFSDAVGNIDTHVVVVNTADNKILLCFDNVSENIPNAAKLSDKNTFSNAFLYELLGSPAEGQVFDLRSFNDDETVEVYLQDKLQIVNQDQFPINTLIIEFNANL